MPSFESKSNNTNKHESVENELEDKIIIEKINETKSEPE